MKAIAATVLKALGASSGSAATSGAAIPTPARTRKLTPSSASGPVTHQAAAVPSSRASRRQASPALRNKVQAIGSEMPITGQVGSAACSPATSSSASSTPIRASSSRVARSLRNTCTPRRIITNAASTSRLASTQVTLGGQAPRCRINPRPQAAASADAAQYQATRRTSPSHCPATHHPNAHSPCCSAISIRTVAVSFKRASQVRSVRRRGRGVESMRALSPKRTPARQTR